MHILFIGDILMKSIFTFIISINLIVSTPLFSVEHEITESLILESLYTPDTLICVVDQETQKSPAIRSKFSKNSFHLFEQIQCRDLSLKQFITVSFFYPHRNEDKHCMFFIKKLICKNGIFNNVSIDMSFDGDIGKFTGYFWWFDQNTLMFSDICFYTNIDSGPLEPVEPFDVHPSSAPQTIREFAKKFRDLVVHCGELVEVNGGALEDFNRIVNEIKRLFLQ